MADNVKSFMLSPDQREYISLLSTEQKAELLDAIYAFGCGEEPHFSDTTAMIAFIPIRQNIERVWAKSASLAENGRKGGKAKKADNEEEKQSEANESKSKQSEAYKIRKDNIIKDNIPPLSPNGDIPPQGVTSAPSQKVKKGKFAPPTVEEVQEYCDKRSSGVDAQRFCDYYAAQGWKLANGQKMQDWQACVRTWEKNDRPTARASPHSLSETERRQRHNDEVCRQVSMELDAIGSPF